LFQIISERYGRGAILMSTNRAFKAWPEIFNNDSTLTSALLDRLVHHADICRIDGVDINILCRLFQHQCRRRAAFAGLNGPMGRFAHFRPLPVKTLAITGCDTI
jgi:hypothetical protein